MEYVIQVGTLYIKEPCENLQLTEDIMQAALFSSGAALEKAKNLAYKVNGTLVSGAAMPQEDSDNVSFNVPAIMKGGLGMWLEQFMPYILNCVGPEVLLVSRFQTWCLSGIFYVDVTKYVGLPCELYVSVYPEDKKSSNKCAFYFTLRTTVPPYGENWKRWLELPYGILLSDGTRVLTESVDKSCFAVSDHHTIELDGRAVIEHTQERRDLIAKHKRGAGRTASTEGVRRMSLG